jgi:hypothetical protein
MDVFLIADDVLESEFKKFFARQPREAQQELINELQRIKFSQVKERF